MFWIARNQSRMLLLVLPQITFLSGVSLIWLFNFLLLDFLLSCYFIESLAMGMLTLGFLCRMHVLSVGYIYKKFTNQGVPMVTEIVLVSYFHDYQWYVMMKACFFLEKPKIFLIYYLTEKDHAILLAVRVFQSCY